MGRVIECPVLLSQQFAEAAVYIADREEVCDRHRYVVRPYCPMVEDSYIIAWYRSLLGM